MNQVYNTKRLILTNVNNNDYMFIAQLVNTKEWIEFIGERNIHSKSDAVQYIKNLMHTPDLIYWVVRNKEDFTPMGIISLLKRDYLDCFDLGFAFLPGFYGKGYAYESAQFVLIEVTKFSKHKKILATTLSHNSKSIKLLQKLGFVFQENFSSDKEKLQVYKFSQKQ